MRKYDSRLVGIFGTVIIHLVAAIIFMLFKIGSQQKIITEQFTVEFAPEEVVSTPEKKDQINLPSTSVEKALQGDNEMLNIARNMANKSAPTVDAKDYIDMVKNELIKSGKLGTDNFIDEQKTKSSQGDENLAMEDAGMVKPGPDKPTASQELAANYKGPTRIYYDLEGRTQTYLPIPIYMCQGSGKVELAITVNQKGDVESAKVIEEESTTNDPCLVETAVKTALVSRFNYDEKAPKSQSGTLTYHFVAQ